MRPLIRSLILCACLVIGQKVAASELAPWMGSQDQAPFQLDPITMVAVTFAADPLHTGSISPTPCQPKTCTQQPKTAIQTSADSGSPQN